jgi:uncharacterized membrane protein YkoI
MLRRKFLTGFLATIATGFAVAPDDAWADHERRPRPRNRNRNRAQPKSFYQEGPAGRSSGQDRARRALREGQVLPLGDIMGIVSRRYPGKVLDADLVQDGRSLVYYLKVLNRQGRVTEVAVDGQSGRILGVRGR